MAFDHWMTPPTEVEKVRKVFGGTIDVDPASNEGSQLHIRAGEYYTIETNGLKQPWYGKVFCNPPYSRGNIDAFVDKAVYEWTHRHILSPSVSEMILLVNSQTDTAWYHWLLEHSSLYLLCRKRIKFWKVIDGVAHPRWESTTSVKNPGKMTNSPRYLNTYFYFGDNVDMFADVFRDSGTLCQVYKG